MAEQLGLHRLFPLGVGIHPADGAALNALAEGRLVEQPACRGTKMASATPPTDPSPGLSNGAEYTVSGPLQIQIRLQRREIASSSLDRCSAQPTCGKVARSSVDEGAQPDREADERDETRYTLYGPEQDKASRQDCRSHSNRSNREMLRFG